MGVGLVVSVLLFSSQVGLGKTLTGFEDVPEGHIAEHAIAWAVEEGITVGVGDNRFGMGQTLTRYEMVTFLCRAFAPTQCRSGMKGSDRFSDVPVDHWANHAIGWAVSNQITSGVSQVAFGGSQTLNREQTVTFLFRAKGSPAGGSRGSDIYTDVPTNRSQWANLPIGWAHDQGIAGGMGTDPSVFGFGTPTVREETVLFICQASAPDICPPAIPSTEGNAATEETTGSTAVSVQLQIAVEQSTGYDRDDWGPHGSSLCREAVGSADPYTATTIDICHVDHVVALHEAHESGGWAWSSDQRRRFSRDPANHVASRACVNQSKSGDDIAEWSDSRIASSAACGGGYRVTAAGRCLLARTTVAVKSAWELTVDQAEADALSATLAGCGDQGVGFANGSENPTTDTTEDACVIADKSIADFDAVYGIGATLAPRLWANQPFHSIADLDAVYSIGPVRANAVWSHFCGSAGSENPTTDTTEATCVISDKSIADFDAVYGIGATLAPRLWANQPFYSIADLDAVYSIGPVRANAVWSHFCR